MRHTTTRGLYGYWNAVRRDRLAPRRYEIEPSQIAPYLAETIILEQPGDDGCRIRLAGTQVCQCLGSDLRGTLFYELWSEDDQVVLRDALYTTVNYGSVGVLTFSGQLTEDDVLAEFELLLLPLTHLADRVERVLGSVSVLSTPAWLETTLPREFTLTSNEVIWPDGRPLMRSRDHENMLNAASPSLLHDTDIRRARLVRREKRSFLVYQGGRAQHE